MTKSKSEKKLLPISAFSIDLVILFRCIKEKFLLPAANIDEDVLSLPASCWKYWKWALDEYFRAKGNPKAAEQSHTNSHRQYRVYLKKWQQVKPQYHPSWDTRIRFQVQQLIIAAENLQKDGPVAILTCRSHGHSLRQATIAECPRPYHLYNSHDQCNNRLTPCKEEYEQIWILEKSIKEIRCLDGKIKWCGPYWKT